MKNVTQAIVRIVLSCLLGAGLWAVLSNRVLEILIFSPTVQAKWNHYKLWVFALVMMSLFFALLFFELKARKRHEQMRYTQSLLLGVTEGITDSVFVKDRQGRYLLFNAGASRMTGKTSKEVLGKDDMSVFSAAEAKQIMEGDQRVIASGVLQTFEEHITIRGELHAFISSKGPLRDSHSNIIGLYGIAHDITERQRGAKELSRLNRALRTIIDCNQALVHATDEAELLDKVCHIIVERGGYRMAWVGFVKQDEAKTVRPVAQAGTEGSYLSTANITWADTERGRGPVGTAIRTGKSCVIRDVLTDPAFMPWRANAIKHGFGSVVSFPLAQDGKFFGALSIYAADPDAFDVEEVSLLKELAGELEYGICALRLRAEHSKSESSLLESERKYRELVENANSIILRMNAEGRITFINEFGQRFFGYSSEEILGRDPVGTIMPFTESGGRDMRQLLDQICANPKAFEQNVNENVRRNGERVWIAWTNRLVLDEEGRMKEILSIGSDITARRQAEALIQYERDFTDAVLKSLPGIFYCFDKDQNFERWNNALERVTGYTSTEIADLKPLDLFIGADKALIEARIKDVFSKGESEVEAELVSKMGTRHFYHFTGRATEINGQMHLVGMGIDVSARKQAEEEVRRLHLDLQRYTKELEMRVRERTAQLEASNKELEAFSYSVSHDLRAPLRGIDGWSQILLDDYKDQLDDQGKQYLQRVRSETKRLGQLIDDLLQLARVSRVEMRPVEVDLTALAQRIAGRIRAAEPNRPIEFLIQPKVTAHGDPQLLEVVLANLLENACKFTSKHNGARIEFGSREELSNGKPVSNVYYIRDNGAGFDMAHVQKLFGAFQRLHKASEFPGTGVGLATVDRIIHRHGGRVWAEGQVEQGATFYFTLPVLT